MVLEISVNATCSQVFGLEWLNSPVCTCLQAVEAELSYGLRLCYISLCSQVTALNNSAQGIWSATKVDRLCENTLSSYY